jgi:hypothetical protein
MDPREDQLLGDNWADMIDDGEYAFNFEQLAMIDAISNRLRKPSDKDKSPSIDEIVEAVGAEFGLPKKKSEVAAPSSSQSSPELTSPRKVDMKPPSTEKNTKKEKKKKVSAESSRVPEHDAISHFTVEITAEGSKGKAQAMGFIAKTQLLKQCRPLLVCNSAGHLGDAKSISFMFQGKEISFNTSEALTTGVAADPAKDVMFFQMPVVTYAMAVPTLAAYEPDQPLFFIDKEKKLSSLKAATVKPSVITYSAFLEPGNSGTALVQTAPNSDKYQVVGLHVGKLPTGKRTGLVFGLAQHFQERFAGLASPSN